MTEAPQVPHRAVIYVQAEVHELLPTGECSGRPAHKVPLFPVYIDGFNKADCVHKLNVLLANWKNECKAYQK